MSDDGILHFNPWMDFNDGPPSENPFGCDPDPEQIAVFLDTVFSWCEGLIPLRGFVDKGQGRDGKPHNIWIPADDTAPGKLATFAAMGEPRGRGRLCHPRHGRGAGPGPRRRRAADAGHRRRSRRGRHPGQAGPCHPPPRRAHADHRKRRAHARGRGEAPCLVETDRTRRGRRPGHPLPPARRDRREGRRRHAFPLGAPADPGARHRLSQARPPAPRADPRTSRRRGGPCGFRRKGRRDAAAARRGLRQRRCRADREARHRRGAHHAGARRRGRRLVPVPGGQRRHRPLRAPGARGPPRPLRGLGGDLRLQRRHAAPVLAARSAAWPSPNGSGRCM